VPVSEAARAVTMPLWEGTPVPHLVGAWRGLDTAGRRIMALKAVPVPDTALATIIIQLIPSEGVPAGDEKGPGHVGPSAGIGRSRGP